MRHEWRRFKKNKVAMVSLFVIILIVLLAIFGPMFSPYLYSDQIRGDESLRPSLKHLLGTDTLGRDMFTRILYGARISLSVGIVACIINLVIGVLYGGISGYFGGRVDSVLMRIVDIIYAIPMMLYVILLTVILRGEGLLSIYIAIGLTYWVTMARIVRGQILCLNESEYITAARALGASHLRILLRHMVPNCIGPIIVTTTLLIPDAIFTEAFLSFTGLGVDAPVASWGSLASDGLGSIRSHFYLLLYPSLAISITILVFNLLGDGLRDAFDPKMSIRAQKGWIYGKAKKGIYGEVSLKDFSLESYGHVPSPELKGLNRGENGTANKINLTP